MVRSSPDPLRTNEAHELGPKRGLELSSAIRGDGGRNTKPGDPTAYESLGDCLRRDSSDGNGFRPPCETVVACEEVGESVRSGERTNDVEMNIVKSSVGVNVDNGVTV